MRCSEYSNSHRAIVRIQLAPHSYLSTDLAPCTFLHTVSRTVRCSEYSNSHRAIVRIQLAPHSYLSTDLAPCAFLHTVSRTVRCSEYSNSHRAIVRIQLAPHSYLSTDLAPCTFLHTVSRIVRFSEYSNSHRAVFQNTKTGKIHEFLTVAHSSINFNTKQLVPQTTITFDFVHRFNARNLTSATQLSFVQQFIDVEPPVQQSTDVEPPVQQSIDVDLQFSSPSMWNL